MSNLQREFNVDKSFLTKEEILILENLSTAAKLISKVYEAQVKSGGFYPHDCTRKEIEKAAEVNPEILSPYTVVERTKEGNLVAIPYHLKYKELLVPVAKLLTETAAISTRHPDFNKALLKQAKALLDGTYDEAQIAWLKVDPYILDIVIGPLERIEDTMFFIKRSYQAWVGVMNRTITERINTLKDIIFAARRQVLQTEKVDFMDKVQIRADETVILTGMMANYKFTATTLPNDIALLEKYGSETWLFLPAIRENFSKKHLPIFNAIFAQFFKHSFTEEELFRGYLLMVSLHEIARVLVRYRFAVDRLKEYYPVFNEATTEALAVKLAGTLLLKDVISQKEMESILVMFLTRIFDGYTEKMDDKTGSTSLVTGNAMMLNNLTNSGALKITKEGMSWPNFTKMFISASELADNMERMLAEGTYNDAKKYVTKHSSTEVFSYFSSSLKALLKS